MTGDQSTQARISGRAILIGAVLLNVIAIGAAEVQRRGLTYRIEDLIQRKNETLEKNIADQGRRVAEMQSAMGALHVLTRDGRFASVGEIDSGIRQRLVDGSRIVVRFDDSPLEDRDSTGAVLCGPEVKNSYLGHMIAGEEYTISYDKRTHQWTGSGPAQSHARDATTGKCGNVREAYGPEQIKKIVTPADGLILWGASLTLDGLDVLRGDKKVGRVVWVD